MQKLRDPPIQEQSWSLNRKRVSIIKVTSCYQIDKFYLKTTSQIYLEFTKFCTSSKNL